MDTSDEASGSPDLGAVPQIIGEDGEPIGRVVRYDAGSLGCDRIHMIERRQRVRWIKPQDDGALAVAVERMR